MNNSSYSIEKLILGGKGLSRPSPSSKKTVFVPYSAPGDILQLALTDKKKFSEGWIQKITSPSPKRNTPPCPYFFSPGKSPQAICGGCDWQHLSYKNQVQEKKELLIEAFQRIGKIPKPNVQDTLLVKKPQTEAWRYRNKVQIPFSKDSQNKVAAGFYAPGSHTIIPFDDCLVQTELSVQIFTAVKEWVQKEKISIYDENKHRGWLRHLLIRTNSQGEALIALITKDPSFSKAIPFSKHLTERYPQIKSIFQNINPQKGNVILGKQWKHLHGTKSLSEKLLGLKFRISPGSFFQIHHHMAESLYTKAIELAAPTKKEDVLELYAGIGAMGQLLAKSARSVWAIEENPQAVSDGIISSKWNEITNIRFIQGRCEETLRRSYFRRSLPNPHIVLIDPPRSGCPEHLLKTLMRLSPQKLIYVSCDPATLARDARYLSTGGYHLKISYPADMFPQTSHIESVSLFQK